MTVQNTKEVYIHCYRDFQRMFHECVASGRMDENLCYDALVGFEESLHASKWLKKDAINDFIGTMIECIDNHLRFALRKNFEEIQRSGAVDERLLSRFDGLGLHYDHCFRTALENFERFGSSREADFVESIECAKKRYAQFSTILNTYRDLLEMETSRRR